MAFKQFTDVGNVQCPPVLRSVCTFNWLGCVKFNIPIILLSVVSLLGFGFTFSEAQFIGEN